MERLNKVLKEKTNINYIVNEKYKILYADEIITNNYPKFKKGKVCFAALGNTKPCEYCPIKEKNKSKHVFNNELNRMIKYNSIELDYPRQGKCNFIYIDDNDEITNDLMIDFSDYNAFSKILEINFETEKYRILVDKSGLSIEPEGDLKTFIDITSDKIIAKDDIKKFKNFFLYDIFGTKTAFNLNYGFKQLFKIKNSNSKYVFIQIVSVEKNEKQEMTKAICVIKYTTKDNISNMSIKIDSLTGLIRGSDFNTAIRKKIDENPNIKYALICIDIEHFKLFNQTYGFKEGDKFLINIADNLLEIDKKIGSVSGYFGNDNFAILIPNTEQNIKLLVLKLSEYIKTLGNGVSFFPTFGVYEITDKQLDVSQMYDRAIIANKHAKGNYTNRVCIYNDTMLNSLEEEYNILQEVKKGMMNGEFTFYLQPQCEINSGKIVSAEALIRWIHPEKGLIPAFKFIPILEKTGFITEIDLFIWESVFKWQRNLIERGIKPLNISVNVSRTDLFYIDIVQVFTNFLDKYKVDASLISIEITEGIYAENLDVIQNTYLRLQELGFKVLIDDFGSGYSSLNMLKNINIDVLKLDMKFLDLNETNVNKGFNILESVVNMIKIINIPIIAEGIETQKQRDLLSEIGCRYGQGYLFYKPMSIDKFEELLIQKENISYEGIKYRQLEKISLEEFINNGSYSDTLINNILGAVAFIEVNANSNTFKIHKINEQYFNLFGQESFTDIEYKNNFLKYFHPEDHKKIVTMFSTAKENLIKGASCELRYIRENQIIWVRTKAFSVNKLNNNDLYYVVFDDITEEKENDQKIKILNDVLKSTLVIGGINSFEWNVSLNELKIFTPFNSLPLYGDNFKHTPSYILVSNFPYSMINRTIIGEQHLNLMRGFMDRIRNGKINDVFNFEMPFIYQNGLSWFKIKGKAVYDDFNNLKLVIGTYKEITDIVEKRIYETSKIKSINILNKNAEYSLYLNLSQNIIYDKTGDIDLTNEKIKTLSGYNHFIRDLSFKSIHKDDKKKVFKTFSQNNLLNIFENGERYVNLDCRINIGNQYLWYKIYIYLLKIENDEDIVGHLYFTNINDLVLNKSKIDINHELNNNIDCAILRFDKKTFDLIYANRQAIELFGYKNYIDLKRHTNNGVVDSIVKKDKEIIKSKMKELKAIGQHQELEYSFINPDNEIKHVLATEMLLEDKHHNLIIQRLIIDNTIQKNIDLELINEKSLFKILSLNNTYDNKALLYGVDKIFVSSYFCNVKSNSFTSFKHTNAVDAIVHNNKTYDEFVLDYANEYVDESDKEMFKIHISREYLINHLSKTNNRNFILYKRKTDDSFRWYKLDFIAVGFDINQTLESFIMLVSDVHAEMNLAYGYKKDLENINKIFVNTLNNLYVDLILIDLDTLHAIKYRLDDNTNIKVPFNRLWDEIFSDLINIIDTNYHTVLYENISVEALSNLKEEEKKFRYRTNSGKWFTSTVKLINFNGRKTAVLFSMDITNEISNLITAQKNSEIDELTGLYNRRKLNQMMDSHYLDLESCGVIFFDINGLKELNDRHGHQAGDIVIKTAAESLKSIENENIQCYRYGGDEFLVVVCNTTKQKVLNLIDEINHNLEIINQRQEYNCTISSGIAYSKENIDIEQLIFEADKEMYNNKNLRVLLTDSHKLVYNKIDSLLNFLNVEYESIYEINLHTNTFNLIYISDNYVNQNISVNGFYTDLNKDITNMIFNDNQNIESIELFSIDNLINQLKDNKVFNHTLKSEKSDIEVLFTFKCIEYDNMNPKIIILSTKII